MKNTEEILAENKRLETFEYLESDPNKRYSVNVTYDKWDQESLEAGDTDDKGFELEDELMDKSEIIRYIQNNGLNQPSCSDLGSLACISNISWEGSYQDPYTGVVTNTYIHLDRVPSEIVLEILIRTGNINDLSGWNKSLTRFFKKVFEELEMHQALEISEPDYPEVLQKG